MSILYEGKDGVWYKRKTSTESSRENQIDIAIQHAMGKGSGHIADEISFNGTNVKSYVTGLSQEIKQIKTNLDRNSSEIQSVKFAHSRIKFLEKELFYHTWFVKKSHYTYLEFDTFEDDKKLMHGFISDGQMIPEPDRPNDYSIYRSIKFLPKLTTPITRYMIHIEYKTEGSAGIIAEISFDNGQKFHTVLSTIQDPNLAHYYQYPDFCNVDNNVPELDADSVIVRFRLLSDEKSSGVSVSSYGILLG